MSQNLNQAASATDGELAVKCLEGVDEFVNSRALEILREWINEPEMLEILRQAGMVGADVEAKKAA